MVFRRLTANATVAQRVSRNNLRSGDDAVAFNLATIIEKEAWMETFKGALGLTGVLIMCTKLCNGLIALVALFCGGGGGSVIYSHQNTVPYYIITSALISVH